MSAEQEVLKSAEPQIVAAQVGDILTIKVGEPFMDSAYDWKYRVVEEIGPRQALNTPVERILRVPHGIELVFRAQVVPGHKGVMPEGRPRMQILFEPMALMYESADQAEKRAKAEQYKAAKKAAKKAEKIKEDNPAESVGKS